MESSGFIKMLDEGDSGKIYDFLVQVGESSQANAFLKEIGKEYCQSFAFLEGEKVLSYVGFLINIDSADLIFVGTDNNSRNKGYATKILDYGFAYLKNTGVKRVLLEVCNKNDKALKLYAKLGFKQLFVRKNYYGNTLDGIVMELVL